MKTTKFLTVLTIITIFFSCNTGPSKEQIEAQQQAHDDSVRKEASIKAHIEQQKADEALAQHQEMIKNTKANLVRWKQQLENENADLDVANSQLADAKDGHIYWSTEHQNEQIREKSLTVQRIQDDIKDLQDRIDKATAILNQQ